VGVWAFSRDQCPGAVSNPQSVIGVAPETFPGMQTFVHPDFYMPLAMARLFSTAPTPQKKFFEDRDDRGSGWEQ